MPIGLIVVVVIGRFFLLNLGRPSRRDQRVWPKFEISYPIFIAALQQFDGIGLIDLPFAPDLNDSLHGAMDVLIVHATDDVLHGGCQHRKEISYELATLTLIVLDNIVGHVEKT